MNTDKRKINTLNQSDFKMKIIKDLGTILPFEGSKKVRYAIFECTKCKAHIKSAVATRKICKHSLCRSCLNSKTSTLYPNKNHDLLKTWWNIKQRCYNKNHPQYPRYGKLGITLCQEWKDDFLKFQEWSLSNGYEKGLAIDKDILCNTLKVEPKIYSPTTCQWITQQLNNMARKNFNKKYICLYFLESSKKWYTTIQISGKKKTLGYFKCRLQALYARDNYIIKNNLPHTRNIIF